MFSIITVIVTAGTLNVFGEAIMDPVMIVERIGNPIVVSSGRSPSSSPRWASTSSPTSSRLPTTLPIFIPRRINFRLGGLITSILSVLVCPWLFVASPQAITLFVSIFGSVLGPLFGIIIADYYLVKRQVVAVEDTLHAVADRGIPLRRRLEPQCGRRPRPVRGALHRAGPAGCLWRLFNVGDWGWLIGAAAGGLLYRALAGQPTTEMALRGEATR